MTFDEVLQLFECEACGNTPDEDGYLKHGKGCFVVSEDGGGSTYVSHERMVQAATAAQKERDAQIAEDGYLNLSPSSLETREAVAAAIRSQE